MKKNFGRLAALLLALAMLIPAAAAEAQPEPVAVEDAPEAAVELGEVDLYDPGIRGDEPDGGPREIMASAVVADAAEGTDEPAEAAVLAPAAVSVPQKLALGKKETYALGLGSAEQSVTYRSSKKKVASVSADGVITGKKKGKATVTVYAGGEKLGSCKVTVKAAPKKVTLEKTLVLNVKATGQLTAKLPKKTAGRITYSSSNSKVAKVDASTGKVTAVKAGTATITAKAFNGKAATCEVTVLAGTAPKTLALNATSGKLCVKETVKLTPKIDSGAKTVYTFTSKNRKVASVSEDGVVTAKKKGSTTITVTTHNGLKATYKVTVRKAPKKVTLNKKKVTLNVNDGFQLKAKLPKGTYTRISYSTSDGKVATVDSSGLIAAVGAGEATITARTLNGKKAKCKVTVKKAAEKITELSGYYLKDITKAAKEIGGLKYEKDSEGFANYTNDALWLWGLGGNDGLFSISLRGKSDYTLLGIKYGMSRSEVEKKLKGYVVEDRYEGDEYVWYAESVVYRIGTKGDFTILLEVSYDDKGYAGEVMYGSWS